LTQMARDTKIVNGVIYAYSVYDDETYGWVKTEGWRKQTKEAVGSPGTCITIGSIHAALANGLRAR
jgi:hypothetical protein